MGRLKVEEMKKICYDISTSEAKKHNINIEVNPLTFITYYKDFINDKDNTLQNRLKLVKAYFRSAGFNLISNDRETKIVVLLKSIKKIKKIDDQIFDLALYCYHEIWHTIQMQFDPYSYEGFLRDCEEYFIRNTSGDYELDHDRYSIEIGANIYGIAATKEYLRTKYPDSYKAELPRIEWMEQEHLFHYLQFDAVDMVDRLITNCRKKYNMQNAKKTSNDEKVKVDYSKISPILDIFLTDKVTFKSFKEIISDERFHKLDERIIAAFLSSKSFLNEQDISNMSYDELRILQSALSYTNQVYINQSLMFDKMQKARKISRLQYIKSQKRLRNKIKAIDIILTKKVKQTIRSGLNVYRDESARKKHIENIGQYLEDTEQQLRKKSRGYLSIFWCYLLGAIISITTIIYLVISKINN